MSKYTHIENAVLEENQELAVDKLEGFYCNGPLAEKIDNALATAEQSALTAEANIDALAKTNDTIAQLNAKIEAAATEKKTLEEQISTLTAEKNDGVTALTEANNKIAEMQTEIDTLKANAQTATTDADAQATAHAEALKAKDEEIAQLKQQLSDKESEIEELSKNAPQATTPVPAKQEEGKDMNGKQNAESPIHFYNENMTSAEREQALAKRMAHLRAKK